MDPDERHDLEAALRAVPGIAHAALEDDDAPGEPGGLGVLRLGLEPGADERAVAAEVGRLLEEVFGVGVDEDGVRVVPADRDGPADQGGHVERTATGVTHAVVPEQGRRGRERPSIAAVQTLSAGLEVTATVTLGSGEHAGTGTACAAASQRGMHRAVASATLQALAELSDDLDPARARLEIEQVEVTPLGAQRTALVAVTLLTDRGSERLTGAAAVREDVRQAVVRATLDAVNRRLGVLGGVRAATA